MKQNKDNGAASEDIAANPEELKNGDGGASQKLKIWHWNVNGIRAVLKSGKFQDFVKNGKRVILYEYLSFSDQNYCFSDQI